MVLRQCRCRNAHPDSEFGLEVFASEQVHPSIHARFSSKTAHDRWTAEMGWRVASRLRERHAGFMQPWDEPCSPKGTPGGTLERL